MLELGALNYWLAPRSIRGSSTMHDSSSSNTRSSPRIRPRTSTRVPRLISNWSALDAICLRQQIPHSNARMSGESLHIRISVNSALLRGFRCCPIFFPPTNRSFNKAKARAALLCPHPRQLRLVRGVPRHALFRQHCPAPDQAGRAEVHGIPSKPFIQRIQRDHGTHRARTIGARIKSDALPLSIRLQIHQHDFGLLYLKPSR